MKSKEKPSLPPIDWSEHLCAVDFELKKPHVLAYIQETFEQSETEWLSCYGVKQKITSRVGYFFAQDMAKYFALAGYQIGLNEHGAYEVKAAYIDKDERYRPDSKAPSEALFPLFTQATPENP